MQTSLAFRSAFSLASPLSMALVLGGCTVASSFDPGEIDFEPDRPETETPDDPDPYTGDDPIVLEAQSKFRTGIEFHQKVIWRTCTPNGGVCHNSKEFPDLRTPANFVNAFGSNCNVQYGEYQSVYDRCERPGDRFRLSGGGINSGQVEVGWLEIIPGAFFEGEGLPPENSPGLHIHLADPMPGDQVEVYSTGEFERTFITDGKVEDFAFAEYTTVWNILPDRTHLIGEVRDYQLDQAQNLLTVGVIEGDPNRNAVFGAREDDPVHLLEPGSPETSYLIARLRGAMMGEAVPGSRMPLANAPFTVPEMLALFCLVEGFPDEGTESWRPWPARRRRDVGGPHLVDPRGQLRRLSRWRHAASGPAADRSRCLRAPASTQQPGHRAQPDRARHAGGELPVPQADRRRRDHGEPDAIQPADR
jgi:hypothetical protein